jgi:Biotin-requiring enzyme/e3 binding domain
MRMLTEACHISTSLQYADIGEGIMEVELLQWFVQPGDAIKQFDKVCEVQSDKATVEITSRYDGTVLTLHHAIGSMVQTGAPLVDIATAAGDPVKPLANAPPNDAASKLTIPSATPTTVHSATSANTAAATADVLIPLADLFGSSSAADAAAAALVLTTPAVRRIAKEYGIQLGSAAHSSLTGTGPRGRLLKGDVVNYARVNGLQPRALSSTDTVTAATATAAAAATAAATTAAVTKGWGRRERAPIAATTGTAAPLLKTPVPAIAAAAPAAPAAAAAAAVGVPQPLWPPQQQQQQPVNSTSSTGAAVAKQAGDAAAGDVIAVRGMQKAMMQQMRSALSVPHMTYCEEVCIYMLSLLSLTLHMSVCHYKSMLDRIYSHTLMLIDVLGAVCAATCTHTFVLFVDALHECACCLRKRAQSAETVLVHVAYH